MNAAPLHIMLTITALMPAVQAESAAENASAKMPAPKIAIKQTAPTEVAFVEHVGPYWSLGPVFARVGALMAARRESGSMFARYDTDPTRTPPSRLRTEVGFVIHGGPPVTYPFKRQRRPGETVAYTVAVGPYATVARHYARIFDWLDINGYEAIGPVTEVYPAGQQPLTSNPQSVVIQVPIVVAALTPAQPVASLPPERETFEPAVVVNPTEITPARPSVSRSLDEARPTIPTVPPKLGDTHDPKTATVAHAVPQRAPAAETEIQDQVVASTTIPELVAAGRFDDVAVRLMPTADAIAPAQQVWFGQAVLRVAAVGRGVAKVYPNADGITVALCRAVEQRYLQIVDNFEHDPRATFLAPARAGAAPGLAARRNVTKDLDTLLGRISVRRASPAVVTRDLSLVLERIAKLLAATNGG